jgi:hypothetical protein
MKRNILNSLVRGRTTGTGFERLPGPAASVGKLLVLAGLIWAFSHCARAQTIDASATISGVQAGVDYDYTITLNNKGTSTSPIETLWYAWVPGADFLPTSPLSVQPPTGWTEIITGGSVNDGYAIQFTTSTSPLNPGNSLLFQFQSADTPTQLAGNSPTHPTFPVGTSVLYSGAPLSVGPSESFVVQSVPEPSSLGLLLIGGSLLLRFGRRGTEHSEAGASGE